MKTIWKYPVELQDEQTIAMPLGAKVIHFGLDPLGVLCLWAEVYPSRPTEARKFHVIGTGGGIPDNASDHLGSVVCVRFVWHLYE